VVEKEKFINWIIFNYLVGNCDAHGKNISLLFTAQGTVLAPFYDLLSTLAYPELSKKMSMKLGRKKRIDWVLDEQWVRFAQETDIKFSMLKEMLTDMANKVRKHSEELIDEFSRLYGEHDIIKKICRLIDSQAKRLH
jgi:serine/threonine-protein kinase HipA